MPLLTSERRAIIIGKIDAVLTAVFAAVGFALTELLAWIATALPQIHTSDWGRYNWVKLPIAITVTAFLKGLDRKKHEDPTSSTGLIEIPKSLGE